MHGRVKTRTSAEQQEAKRKEREKKTKLYRAGIDKLFAKRQTKELDEEALVISAQLLTANPDITTVWNIRREVLLHLQKNSEQTEEDTKQQFLGELQLTEVCLRANPKSYGGWHHRRWVMIHMPEPNWERELALCNKYLELDERNFHCWDYRRFVVEQSKVPAEVEFEYSTKKILDNFSNYSSWHYRSRLLPCIHPDPLGKLPIKEDKHKEELELVHNAAFTDPNDQSAWFYQRWLLGRSLQPLTIASVYITRNVAYVTLTQNVNISETGKQLDLIVGWDETPVSWISTNSSSYCNVWISSSLEGFLPEKDETPVVLNLCDGSTVLHGVRLKRDDPDVLVAATKPQFSAGFSEGITSVLQCELDSCLQLLDLEPDSKWTLLTTVLLMQAINRSKYEKDTFDKLDLLVQVDPQRGGYYKDLRSRYKMEYAIDRYQISDVVIELPKLSLTALYHCQYLACVQIVDLSYNNLTSRSLSQLHPLQCCKLMNLGNNHIQSLKEMPGLSSLLELSLRNNSISSSEEVKFLKNCNRLTTLNLTGNSMCKDESLKTILPSVRFFL